MLAHELAKMCGINMPEARLQKFSDLGSTVLFKRFDRERNAEVWLTACFITFKFDSGDFQPDIQTNQVAKLIF